MTSLRFTGLRTSSPLRTMPRMPRMISPPRRPSDTTASKRLSSFGRSARPLAMKRRPALALFTMPVSGWFSSCASAPAISPMIATRLKCAISSRCCRVCASACLRAEMSTMTLKTSVPSGLSMRLLPISTGNSVPSLRRANNSRPAPMARAAVAA